MLWHQRYRLDGLVVTDPAAILPLAQTLSLEMLGTIVAVLALIAAADYLFQYRQWFERQKMAVRELKEEFKQTEGDPAIKAKIRQIRQTRMSKRMMAALPTASVVITNPTHFAVALRYDRGMNAPVCVAKGVDALALQDPRGRNRAFDPGGRESAAGARAARNRRDRPGDPARALPGGGRGHRLRDAAQSRGRRPVVAWDLWDSPCVDPLRRFTV